MVVESVAELPELMVVGATEITGATSAELIVSEEDVPLLGRFPVSPGYDAWRVAVPVVEPVTVIEQLVPDSVQVEDDSDTVPVPEVCENVIVSPDTEPLAPETVAVHPVEEETSMSELVQTSEVVVVDRGSSAMPASAQTVLDENVAPKLVGEVTPEVEYSA